MPRALEKLSTFDRVFRIRILALDIVVKFIHHLSCHTIVNNLANSHFFNLHHRNLVDFSLWICRNSQDLAPEIQVTVLVFASSSGGKPSPQ
ncbi:hypothetical protein CGERO_09185 [Corynebacterium gerontici]|uniref:Uncharacterized protein n=1 Tax=Corynebacterium gerontici TaxID=2079234 RepID=A0A3G6J5C6_9CORY|nr:hypothetical protein CGERO_09185 [Corynebacterium gerontici]